jgi:hypothetical protein
MSDTESWITDARKSHGDSVTRTDIARERGSEPSADISHSAIFILASTGLVISLGMGLLVTVFLAIAFSQECEPAATIQDTAAYFMHIAKEDVPPLLNSKGLPSIDSIDGQTDISVFLRRNVAAEMRVAALRRAWLMDPAIRDFKGLQEVDWNFDATSSIPGFGDLGPEVDIARMVAHVIGEASHSFACFGKPDGAYKVNILASIFLPRAKGLACD